MEFPIMATSSSISMASTLKSSISRSNQHAAGTFQARVATKFAPSYRSSSKTLIPLRPISITNATTSKTTMGISDAKTPEGLTTSLMTPGTKLSYTYSRLQGTGNPAITKLDTSTRAIRMGAIPSTKLYSRTLKFGSTQEMFPQTSP